ncbi:hypothetical protein C789_1130 [Microcystis aeruginosa FACHB-905 = DIANCHI905]|uniref:Uncharacterized protein n=1 Tax=Microcystis panniformis FACHB-1757 TaxID=1638788 RepID=A0A0K1RYG7_9CHRO|nr:hypothetical protein VL20_1790 [Microcystis panniformis FACHB-1757]ELS49062.1 hypothetical protein C789_1130 [Microcystis aeruginosa FACHB-905 = DIANCHI905]
MNNLWIKTLKFNEPSIQWFYISLFSKFINELREHRKPLHFTEAAITIKNEGNYLS